MRYYIIAGEASGDLHGSNLIKEFKKLDPNAEFRGFGGDLMKSEDTEIAMHIKELAFMGIWEVIANLKTIKKNIEFCKNDIKKYKPDLIILIDYSGFNLRIAEFAKSENLLNYFYIAPKVWVTRKSRIKKLKAFVDRTYVILPFEKDFLEKNGCPAFYLGNPLMDAISRHKKIDSNSFFEENQLTNKPIVAILPGSRKQEIFRCLPLMLEASKEFEEYQFVVAGARSIDKSFYSQYTQGYEVGFVHDQTYDLLHHSQAAIVVSGTATLETALHNVPQVVVYKANTSQYIIIRPLIRLTFFSLVNLIMDKEVVKELLQFNLVKKIKNELSRILYNTQYKNEMLKNYAALQKIVGGAGTSERVAKDMFSNLKHST